MTAFTAGALDFDVAVVNAVAAGEDGVVGLGAGGFTAVAVLLFGSGFAGFAAVVVAEGSPAAGSCEPEPLMSEAMTALRNAIAAGAANQTQRGTVRSVFDAIDTGP